MLPDLVLDLVPDLVPDLGLTLCLTLCLAFLTFLRCCFSKALYGKTYAAHACSAGCERQQQGVAVCSNEL